MNRSGLLRRKFAAFLIALTVTSSSWIMGAGSAHAAVETDQVEICASGYSSAVVIGWNQDDQYVVSPHIALDPNNYGCGTLWNWWWQRWPKTIQVNLYDASGNFQNYRITGIAPIGCGGQPCWIKLNV
ncbi:hypothetical protein ACFZBE_41255 [Streptomyces sp. NPDC008061]|uniref:hypothetical protein n=1 Tax=Streptomyces sp. NPDC008061 TaxID=3364805 RepID=UPI0036EE2A87